jgi:hypothetical protein
VRSSGSSKTRSSATTTCKAALKSYGDLGRDRQRNWESFSSMVRGVSDLYEGSKILFFLYRSRLVCTSLLHLPSSWNSANFGFTEFSEVRERPGQTGRLVAYPV